MGPSWLSLKRLAVFSDIWDLGRYCREKQLEYQERGSASRRNVIPGKLLQKQNEDEPAAKKIKFDDDVIERNVAFFRTHYEDGKFSRMRCFDDNNSLPEIHCSA